VDELVLAVNSVGPQDAGEELVVLRVGAAHLLFSDSLGAAVVIDKVGGVSTVLGLVEEVTLAVEDGRRRPNVDELDIRASLAGLISGGVDDVPGALNIDQPLQLAFPKRPKWRVAKAGGGVVDHVHALDGLGHGGGIADVTDVEIDLGTPPEAGLDPVKHPDILGSLANQGLH